MLRVIATCVSSARSLPMRLHAAVIGGAFALAPAAAFAEESSRTLGRPDDWGTVMLLTALGAVGVGVLYSIGYLYRRKRGLDWEFQKPDAPADHH